MQEFLWYLRKTRFNIKKFKINSLLQFLNKKNNKYLYINFFK